MMRFMFQGGPLMWVILFLGAIGLLSSIFQIIRKKPAFGALNISLILSTVLAGATLGYLVAIAVVRDARGADAMPMWGRYGDVVFNPIALTLLFLVLNLTLSVIGLQRIRKET
jgi:hypothetical protein